MELSRRTLLGATGIGGLCGLAGCAAEQADPAALRDALSTTLHVSRRTDSLVVRTSEAFAHDVLVAEAGHGFVLAMPGLEASTTALVPRETVRFSAREAGTDDPYVPLATYTVPFPHGGGTSARPPEATVRFERRAATTVECVLESLPNATSVRIGYPDDRADDVLLWAGHRVTASDLPTGTIRAFATAGTAERPVDSYRLG